MGMTEYRRQSAGMGNDELAEECRNRIRTLRSLRPSEHYGPRKLCDELWFLCCESGRRKIFEEALAAVKAEEAERDRANRIATEQLLERLARKEATP
jgi:hypothetical protein